MNEEVKLSVTSFTVLITLGISPKLFMATNKKFIGSRPSLTSSHDTVRKRWGNHKFRITRPCKI